MADCSLGAATAELFRERRLVVLEGKWWVAKL
jgi:hypothetical protein